MGDRMTIEIPDFGNDEEDSDISQWLKIAIWVITVVIELLKKVSEIQRMRDKKKTK